MSARTEHPQGLSVPLSLRGEGPEGMPKEGTA